MGTMPNLPWRQILILFAAMLLCTALWAEARQDLLAGHVIRLHVLANSDAEEDQALKLHVRDQVLRETRSLLRDARESGEAAALLEKNLDQLTETARREIAARGYDYPVRVTLEETWFPTRVYQSAALPAGTYEALRVVIGTGEGRNWWCVVFPSLCLPAVSEASLQADGFSKADAALITEATPGCVFRFKTVEWWETFKHMLS